ncbi:elongation of very long chain fatty acids protein F [Drosophila guanche]|uniref:Elongation of very long chain fatty acids protein n=1 Tax=Drosophila guanche TaxID=7266 RepID=A0A3B0JJ84_DROGU|nr:elongation of very long chain fatty acids protein F [Drosophila guanche]SPP73509.1 blast:Elongation of very long chain fatty acids protein AAEL008004 [Drosophila guanche]
MNSSTILDIFRTPPADPVKLPIYSSPLVCLLIVLGYLVFVLKLGRDFMANRKPYNVRRAMLVYNLCQILMNIVLFGLGFHLLFVRRIYNLRCMTMLPLEHPDKFRERLIVYAYFINKLLDLLDTLFFVLRKSYKQITVLHVYHHALMVLGPALVLHFFGTGGQYCTMGVLNSFVHIVMYSYYFVAAQYPQIKGKLWWKQYITKLQLLQFVILALQAALVLCFNPGCAFPRFLQYLQLAVSASMMIMFGNFYYQSYIKPKSKSQ